MQLVTQALHEENSLFKLLLLKDFEILYCTTVSQLNFPNNKFTTSYKNP